MNAAFGVAPAVTPSDQVCWAVWVVHSVRQCHHTVRQHHHHVTTTAGVMSVEGRVPVIAMTDADHVHATEATGVLITGTAATLAAMLAAGEGVMLLCPRRCQLIISHTAVRCFDVCLCSRSPVRDPRDSRDYRGGSSGYGDRDRDRDRDRRSDYSDRDRRRY